MNKIIMAVLLMMSASAAMAVGDIVYYGDQKIFTCDPPTTREDGNPIEGVVDYTIYMQHESTGQVIVQSGLVFCGATVDMVVNMPEGQYNSWMTATETTDIARESIASSPLLPFVLRTFVAPPNAPTNLRME